MATLGGDPDQREKQRLCPSCRMSISALATRCHYCGEEVARPKVEDRKLTINDLGGPPENKFQLSGSVLNALEAFRMEEGVSETPKPEKSSTMGKRPTDPGVTSPAQGSTTLLDELGLAPKPVKQVETRRDPSWVTKMGVLGGFIAAIVILFFGGVKGFAMISDYLEQKRLDELPKVVNRAPGLLAQGDVLGALEAAVEANKLAPNEENMDILAQIRHMIGDQVRQSLDSREWRKQNLIDASALAHKAASIDPSNRLLSGFIEQIDAELEAYTFLLLNIDRENRTATFRRQHNGRSQEATVGQDEKLWGRFDVVSVLPDAVILVDNEREMGQGKLRRVRVGVDGTIMLNP